MSESARDEVSRSKQINSGRSDLYGIAAGMLRNDKYILIPLAGFLALSVGVDLLLRRFNISSWGVIAVVDRILQIAVVAFIAARWRKRLQAQPEGAPNVVRLAARIAPISVASSFLLVVPFFGFALNPGGATTFLFVVLGTLGIIWSLRVYFYFAVVALLGIRPNAALARAAAMTKADGTAALKTLVAPCAYTLLLTALFTLPSPSGRSLMWMSIASAAECVFWILSTYLALGYVITTLGDAEWRNAGLTPYRADKLATLQTQGGKQIAKYLSAKFGLGISLLAFVLMMVNLGRQFNEPPVAQVEIKRVVVNDYSIKLELAVEDRQYMFRGFHPVGFSVKTQTGFALANALTSVALTPDGAGFVGSLASEDGAQKTLFLTFSSGKTAAALKNLDNVWLWYQAVPLLAITPEMLSAENKS